MYFLAMFIAWDIHGIKLNLPAFSAGNCPNFFLLVDYLSIYPANNRAIFKFFTPIIGHFMKKRVLGLTIDQSH